MPWKMWNQYTNQYDVKADDAADIFDVLEMAHREHERSKAIGERECNRPDITPYSDERLREISIEDRAINTASEYLDARSKRLFCRYCGEETTQNNGDRTFCNHRCKQNMAYYRKMTKMKLAEEFREENQWQDSKQW